MGWKEARSPEPSRVPARMTRLTDMNNPVCMSDNYLTKSFQDLGLDGGTTNKKQNNQVLEMGSHIAKRKQMQGIS